MWYVKIYYIISAFLLILGITVIPSALANTAIVIIIPGSGPGKNCSDTATCFSPSIVNISPGDTVTWKNNDNVDHIVVSGLPYAKEIGTIFDSGTIPPGKIYSFTFLEAGTYKYSDKIDKWMVGEVIVGSQSSPTIPEFGATTGMIITISIIGVVTLSTRFRSRS